MPKKNAIGLLLAAGLIAGCSSVIDKPSNDTQNLILNESAMEERATALQAMYEMSSYLRSLKKFTVKADVSFDEVLVNGQKVLLSKTVDIRAEMPSKLWAETSTQYAQREFYFDGQTFSLYTPSLGYYASADMPMTIGQLVIQASKNYDIEIPIADLFLWGTQADSSADVQEAIIVGVDQVNGVKCNQFAFREQEIDWQICIQRDGTPLPLKLVITEKDIATQPQHISVLTWNTAPDLSAQNYTFKAHEGDQKINFGKVKIDKQGE